MVVSAEFLVARTGFSPLVRSDLQATGTSAGSSKFVGTANATDQGDIMKKAMLLSVAIVLCAALALAQDTAPGGSSQSTTSTSQTTTTERNSSGKTIQGCLTGASGNYMLTDAMGMSYKVLGDESQLSDNVNKQVEVTGMVGASASAS